MKDAFDVLVQAIADSKLCVSDTTLPHPSECPGDCTECFRDAAIAAEAVKAQKSIGKDVKVE